MAIGRTFEEVECHIRTTERSDLDSGELRETHIWASVSKSKNLTVSIIEGLRSSEDDPDLPLHKPARIGHIGTDDMAFESIES